MDFSFQPPFISVVLARDKTLSLMLHQFWLYVFPASEPFKGELLLCEESISHTWPCAWEGKARPDINKCIKTTYSRCGISFMCLLFQGFLPETWKHWCPERNPASVSPRGRWSPPLSVRDNGHKKCLARLAVGQTSWAILSCNPIPAALLFFFLSNAKTLLGVSLASGCISSLFFLLLLILLRLGVRHDTISYS